MPRAARAWDTAKPLLLALAFLVVVAAVRQGLLDSLGTSSQFSLVLAGSFAFHLAARPSRTEIAITFLLGLALELAYSTTFVIKQYFGSTLIVFAGFLGLASLIVLAYSAVRSKRLFTFGTAAFFPFLSVLAGFALPVTNRMSPFTFDAHLFAADSTLGFQPGFILGRAIGGRPLLWNLTSTLYYALPFAVCLLCAAMLRKNSRQAIRLMCLFGSLSAVGVVLYAVCPATGPSYAFHGWYPWKLPRLSLLSLTAPLLVPDAPRNAMPSLHFGGALLIFWNTARMSKAARIAAALFLAGTAFAILALGEHYLIDAIAAFPVCLALQAAYTLSIAGYSRPVNLAMWTGAALAFGWPLLLRFAIRPLVEYPAVAWVGFLATVGFSIWARHALLQLGDQPVILDRA